MTLLRSLLFLAFVSWVAANPVARTQSTQRSPAEFPVHRALHFSRNGLTLGTASVTLSLTAINLCTSPLWNATNGGGRFLGVYDFSCGKEVLDAAVTVDRVVAFLVVLKHDLLSEKQLIAAELEDWIVKASSKPIMFARPEEVDLDSYFASTNSSVLLEVTASNAAETKLNARLLEVSMSQVPFSQSTVSADALPWVVVAAHYDTLSLVPSMSADMSSAGLLIELVRLAASTSTSTSSASSPFRLLFLLDGAGRVNFHGLQNYLQGLSADLRDEILMAVYLDALDPALVTQNGISIVRPSDSFVQTAGSAKPNKAANDFVDRLQVAIGHKLSKYTRKSSSNVPAKASVVVRKVDLRRDFALGHEAFTMNGVPAVSLTAIAASQIQPQVIGRNRIFSVPAQNSLYSRRDVLKTVFESILYAAGKYAKVDDAPPTDAYRASDALLAKYEQELTEKPVFPGHRGATSDIISWLQNTAEGRGVVREIAVDEKDGLTWYDKQRITATLYNVRSVAWDLTIAGLVMGWTGIVHLIIKKLAI
eukprot:ANDGO_01197.mRNA.1 hypothetical protein GUITHDRAFT_146649